MLTDISNMKKLTAITLLLFIIGCNQNQYNLNYEKSEIQIDDLILEPSQIEKEDLKVFFPEEYHKLYSGPEVLGVTQNNVRVWPNGKVYFRFASNITKKLRSTILNVCNSFSSFANIECIEDTKFKFHSVNVTIGNSDCSGHSSLGYKPGQTQVLHLNIRCPENLLVNRLIPHELMHTLGISHEHQQPDRDQYIRINYDYMIRGHEHNFIRIHSAGARTKFDTNSIMLYTSFSFGKVINGKVHFTVLKRSAKCDKVPNNATSSNIPSECIIQQSLGLSAYDRALIAHLY